VAHFTPQPGPQEALLGARWCEEVFFGGARGGGKSWAMLGDYAQDIDTYQDAWKGVFIRQTYPELTQAMEDAYEIFSQTEGRFKAGEKVWEWPNGAKLYFRSLESSRDIKKIQGQGFQWMAFDESTNYPDLSVIKLARGSLRSGKKKVPHKRIRVSGNPGGPGHSAFKTYYIDPCPRGYQPIIDINSRGKKSIRMYIPSRVTDNKILQINDPEYEDRLSNVGSETQVQMWLEGRWDVVAGAYFDCFSEKNVIDPFYIPRSWQRLKVFDWGYADPFCCLWFAISDGSIPSIPKGALVCYRELYGAVKTDEGYTGCRWNDSQIMQAIRDAEAEADDPECYLNIADRRFFDASRTGNGISLAESSYRTSGIRWKLADDSRVTGWQQLRSRILASEKGPMMQIFSNCQHLIRVFPLAQHSEINMEDLEFREDHPLDCARYASMTRLIASVPKAIPYHDGRKTTRLLYPEIYKKLAKSGLKRAA
jgi:hypothetical protein